jgi:hypothetical protein
MMNQKQADDIIDFVYGMHRPPDKELTRDTWRIYLAPLDPDIATTAMINGLQVWESFPKWPAFMVEYHQVERRREMTSESEKMMRCLVCGDTGWVIAKLRYDETRKGAGEKAGPFEETAPCPSCELGKRIEREQYGDEGYWQGRDTSYLLHAEQQGERGGAPDWVGRWQRARADWRLGRPGSDQRPFPEQNDALTAEERPRKPFSDVEAWVQEEEYSYTGEGHA